MPHASEVHQLAKERILAYGHIGSGKTTLFRTMPGRKFLYLFDPAGITAIKPTDDIQFEMFLPEIVPMSVVSLSKDKGGDTKVKYTSQEQYLRWEQDFESRLEKGWFTNPEVIIDGVAGGFDSIGFDSFTTLSDLIMDRILEINKRPGKFPEQDDWTVQMNTLQRIVRNATALGLYVYFTGHEEISQDKTSKVIANQIMLTGKLKAKLPILFSDIFHTRVDIDKNGKPAYFIDTVPERMYPTMRCSLELPPTVDVTIPKGTTDPTLFGLGKLLKK